MKRASRRWREGKSGDVGHHHGNSAQRGRSIIEDAGNACVGSETPMPVRVNLARISSESEAKAFNVRSVASIYNAYSKSM